MGTATKFDGIKNRYQCFNRSKQSRIKGTYSLALSVEEKYANFNFCRFFVVFYVFLYFNRVFGHFDSTARRGDTYCVPGRTYVYNSTVSTPYIVIFFLMFTLDTLLFEFIEKMEKWFYILKTKNRDAFCESYKKQFYPAFQPLLITPSCFRITISWTKIHLTNFQILSTIKPRV